MSKIRILSSDVVILGLLVAGGLRANTITTYSGSPYNVNMNLSQSYNPNIVGSTITNSNTTYSNYVTTTTVQNNTCITGYCGPLPVSNTGNINIPTITSNLQTPISVPGSVIQASNIGTISVPGSVVQPSNTSTVTTNIPTIQVTTNFNTMPLGAISAFAEDPEPSTVLLLVSGMAALGILHRRTTTKKRLPLV